MSLELSGTTGVKGVAGSVSAPSIVGDDTNTGISFPAADTIKFSTGGVERMSITNSGISGITAGKVLQVVQVENTAFSTSTANAGDQTGQMMDASITPSASSSKILIQAMFHVGISSGVLRVGCRLIINDNYNSNTGNGQHTDNRRYISSATTVQSNNDQQNIHYSYLHSANTTSSTKYGFTFLHSSGSSRTISLNRSEDNNNAYYNHTGISTIILTEIGA